MLRAIQFLVALTACLLLQSCSEREPVGGGYTLVTPESWGLHHHPGTALRYRGREIWPHVFGFHPDAASRFYHEGIFVFIANVPANTDWWYYPQLFAVRGAGPPVVLSERLFKQPLMISTMSGAGSKYSVRHLAATDSGVRFAMVDWPDHNQEVTTTNELSWSGIKQMLDEADKSARLVEHSIANYRVLPAR